MAYIDMVLARNFALWDTPSFDPVYRDGNVYERGTENNGQSVISSIFVLRLFLDVDLERMSLGVAYISDEEQAAR